MKNQIFNKEHWCIGYIFSREIKNSYIPQKVQNLVIRDYAKRLKANLKLSATEYKMKKSFLILKSLIKKNANFSGIILYSYSMLLELSDYEDLIKKCLKNKINLFFALEEFSIKNNKDIEKLKQIFRIGKSTI
jgi:sporadic carbohydrate cluster protein (TIGR04323 family)